VIHLGELGSCTKILPDTSLDRQEQRLSPRDDDGLRRLLHHDGEKDYEDPLFVFLSLFAEGAVAIEGLVVESLFLFQ
jgi:hypothetical protein